MTSLSNAKQHLQGLLRENLEGFAAFQGDFVQDTIRVLLREYFGKATLTELTELALYFEDTWGVSILPEWEETEHD